MSLHLPNRKAPSTLLHAYEAWLAACRTARELDKVLDRSGPQQAACAAYTGNKIDYLHGISARTVQGAPDLCQSPASPAECLAGYDCLSALGF